MKEDTSMRRLFGKAALPVAGMAGVVFASFLALGQEGLEPMAGTGGVMRDAERRALTPPPADKDRKVPQIAASAPKKDSAGKDDDKVLGPITEVRFYGATNFAEQVRLPQGAELPNGEKLEDDMSLGDGLLKSLDDGEPKTRGQVREAMAKMRHNLLEAGYYLVRLSPARREAFYSKDSHTLGVLVDDGRLGKINVKFEDGADEGTWYSKAQILRRFRYLREGDTFDYKQLRSALFDANSHPDLIIDTSIEVRKPIEGEGNDRRVARYADLDLTVYESIPLHMVWEVNNFGMEEVDEWQTSLTMQYLNLTKHDDVLTISPAMSFGAELMSVAASYMLPHTWWLGGNTTLYGGWSSLDVDDIVPRLDLEGAGWFTGIQHSEYLYDSERHLWAVSVGLLWRYIEDQYTALGRKLNKRDVSILPISAALSYTGKKADGLGGRNFATFQGVFNVASSGDDLSELWTGAEENYWILRWQLARLQPLFGFYNENTKKNDLHQWMLFLKLEGQYTADNLIPTEKLSLGGYNTMRGYHTRGYIGDYGIYGTAELRTPILVDGIASLFGDRTDKTPIDRLQGLCFVDYGWTAFNDLPSGYDDNEFLCSVGIGARAALTKYSQLRCDVAFPIADAYGDDDSMEFYLSVQVQF